MNYKRSEIKELTTESIIANIFYYGIGMSNEDGTKRMDKELAWHCDELARRGVVVDGNYLYEMMCQ